MFTKDTLIQFTFKIKKVTDGISAVARILVYSNTISKTNLQTTPKNIINTI